MESCPKELEPFLESYRLKSNRKDVEQWQLGQYITAAISTIGKGKYPKKPMFQIAEEKEITERDIQMAILTEKRYMAMAANRGLPETMIK